MEATATAPTTLLREAVGRATERFGQANPRSLERFAAATEHLPGGDTRSILHYAPFPATIVRAEGAQLEDIDGHTYTDFLGEYTAGLFGHSHLTIFAELRNALDGGLSYCGPHPNQHEFAALICRRFGLERVRFTNSGTEANLMALAAARAITGRGRIMAFDGAYHGGRLSFVGGDELRAPFEWVVGTYNDPDETRRLIEEQADDLAVVIAEPMLGSCGIAATREFFGVLREESARVGAIFIVDEVQTSRLGRAGLQAEFGVHADITTLGKYLGGGCSFGAFGGRADVMDRFDPRRDDHLHHAGTFNNNVLTMAAGLAGLRDVYTPTEAERLTARGDEFRERLNRTAMKRDAPVQIIGRGSIMSIHFQGGRIERVSDVLHAPEALQLFHLEMLLAGFYTSPRGFLSLSLALTDENLDAFDAALGVFLDRHGAALKASTA